MIKYAGKYKLVKADALAKKLPLRDSAHKVLGPEDVEMLKQRLGDKYFGILYSRQGFYTTFLKQYWEAEKYLMLQSRAREAKEGGSLLTAVCLAYLRHMMALRLDALSQFDEYHKAKCDTA